MNITDIKFYELLKISNKLETFKPLTIEPVFVLEKGLWYNAKIQFIRDMKSSELTYTIDVIRNNIKDIRDITIDTNNYILE